jgi:hypothetical protein
VGSLLNGYSEKLICRKGTLCSSSDMPKGNMVLYSDYDERVSTSLLGGILGYLSHHPCISGSTSTTPLMTSGYQLHCSAVS